MGKEAKLPELLTLVEACQILNVHPNTLCKWDKKGILVAVHFGERKDKCCKKEDMKELLRKSLV